MLHRFPPVHRVHGATPVSSPENRLSLFLSAHSAKETGGTIGFLTGGAGMTSPFAPGISPFRSSDGYHQSATKGQFMSCLQFRCSTKAFRIEDACEGTSLVY